MQLDGLIFDAVSAAAHGDTTWAFCGSSPAPSSPAAVVRHPPPSLVVRRRRPSSAVRRPPSAVQGHNRGWVGERNVVSVGFQCVLGAQAEQPFQLAHGHVVRISGLPDVWTETPGAPPNDSTE